MNQPQRFECPVLLADFKILMRSRYDYVVRLCADYRLPALSAAEADLVVEVSDAEFAAEQAKTPANMEPGYIESICLYRAICRALPPLGGMLLHSAVIADGPDEAGATRGYAFTADSGTGKTTHIRLWRRAFGECVRVINGDKPLVRRRDGVWYAYGTPWCGKEGWHRNEAVPLSGICFLRRGATNTIRPLPIAEAIPAVLPQLVLPEDPAAMAATFDLLDSLLTETPLYELHCTISEEAAHVAREGMRG